MAEVTVVRRSGFRSGLGWFRLGSTIDHIIAWVLVQVRFGTAYCRAAMSSLRRTCVLQLRYKMFRMLFLTKFCN
ncbi:hypothetical protein HanRHA438_Chr04g0165571 [Helianthus annuus]|uniref:Uncharacterized protein n=1 Tax=Helianthus annuus TaxID=4232 RepID=A0A9K3J6F9_HELAN|nr:hypothetical protein HanXRQr2_Chr04g0155471 [Helianthus annuus]KAJ0580309.1 hypothetical protein HanHA300_Chr04g0127761 [Helianthus annuus]KAJ0587812.1 hypothetical protein HanIR_Chr04g0167461 [Helianthus annuus]KAJ0596255.1 hypothetical protein HanHA89_Chr04g0140701 [Helianthus annuus]KAJ0756914.1 hypothetical protein HanLR1_Chr04g0132531 [Helianthus annuus]